MSNIIDNPDEALATWQSVKPMIMLDFGKALFIYEKIYQYGVSFGNIEVACKSALESGYLKQLCDAQQISVQQYYILCQFVVATSFAHGSKF